jgi:hypothetical protein
LLRNRPEKPSLKSYQGLDGSETNSPEPKQEVGSIDNPLDAISLYQG